MPEVNVYSSDPGLEVLLGKGAAINAITRVQRSPSFASGLTVLGIVGAVTNDEGTPNVPIELTNKSQDLLGRFGPFSPYVGNGAASGYEGNAAAVCYGLDAGKMVLVAPDLALKDKTITDETAVDLPVRVARGALAFTVEESNDVWSVDGHTFAVNDTVQLVSLTGGTGAVVSTTYHVIAPVVAGVSFKLSATEGGSSLAITLDGTGTLRPIAWAAADLDPLTLPAGTRIKTSGGGFVVRTLEPLFWDADEFEAQSVRVAKVSGTVAAINTVNTFVDTLTDTSVVTHTTATTVPDDVDTTELVARYQAALDAINNTALGRSIDVIITDQNEGLINYALAAHCATSRAQGYFRRGVISPSAGTSVVDAQGSAGEGIASPALDQSMVAYAHPGWQRPFILDADNLSAPDYLATFTSHALLAALMCSVRPEENPARPLPPGKAYGATGVEGLSVAPVGSSQWAAHICMPTFERVNGNLAPSYRDGVMADGTEIASARTLDWVTENLIERATPFHKTIASPSNREACVDSCRAWLQSRLDAERIAGFAIGPSWDALNRHLTINVVVEEVGTLNVITFSVVVGTGVLAPGDVAQAA